MKITEITTYSVHTTQFRNFNFVRIDTDEGIHGIGELFCIGADKAVAEMVKYVSEWVVGMDPLDRERIQKRIINYSRFPGGSVLYTAASSPRTCFTPASRTWRPSGFWAMLTS